MTLLAEYSQWLKDQPTGAIKEELDRTQATIEKLKTDSAMSPAERVAVLGGWQLKKQAAEQALGAVAQSHPQSRPLAPAQAAEQLADFLLASDAHRAACLPAAPVPQQPEQAEQLSDFARVVIDPAGTVLTGPLKGKSLKTLLAEIIRQTTGESLSFKLTPSQRAWWGLGRKVRLLSISHA